MAKMKWNEVGTKRFETGISEGAIFVGTPKKGLAGVPFDGLTGVDESPDGGDANDQFANNVKWLSLRGPENYKGTIKSFMYPEEFEPCMGNAEVLTSGNKSTGAYFGSQSKLPFSMAYKTVVGSDDKGIDFSEKLHVFWNATCSPVDKSYVTINESPEAMEMSWEFDTVPVPVGEGFKPSAHFEMTKTTENATVYQSICDALYGTDDEEPSLLMPADIVALLKAANIA